MHKQVLSRLLPVLATGLVAATTLSGCASTPEYCDQLASAETAVEQLVNTDVLAEGTNTLSERFDTAVAEVEELGNAAESEFAEEVAAVEAAIDRVGGVVETAANLDLGTAAAEAQPAIQELQTATEDLFVAVTSAC